MGVCRCVVGYAVNGCKMLRWVWPYDDRILNIITLNDRGLHEAVDSWDTLGTNPFEHGVCDHGGYKAKDSL